MEPTIGRIVYYKLSSYDAKVINWRRTDACEYMRATASPGQPGRTGPVLHLGNEVCAGNVFPAMVVTVWPGGLVNLQVFLDGSDTLWATSCKEGDGEHQWSWPATVSSCAARVEDELGRIVVHPADLEALMSQPDFVGVAEYTRPGHFGSAVPGEVGRVLEYINPDAVDEPLRARHVRVFVNLEAPRRPK